MVNLMVLENDDVEIMLDGEQSEGWKVADDSCADWAINKIARMRADSNRIKALLREKIERYSELLAAETEKGQKETAYLELKLKEYFDSVPEEKKKSTKTLTKYRLASGELVAKQKADKYTVDDEKLVVWLEAAGYEDFVKVEKKAKWGELKKQLTNNAGTLVLPDTGEVVDGVTVEAGAIEFSVEANI